MAPSGETLIKSEKSTKRTKTHIFCFFTTINHRDLLYFALNG